MSKVDAFLEAVLPIQRAAEGALVSGNAQPRREFWSQREPVTILGAGRDSLSRHEVDEVFDRLASLFSNGRAELEVIAADATDDMGYIVGYERLAASIENGPETTFELRVTLIFRREHGQWRAVHRHADPRTKGNAGVERVRQLLNE
jgi:ketosteroid isomerase-like protein